MLSAAVAALACLCMARCSPSDPAAYGLRFYMHGNAHSLKELNSILERIDERLRVLDTVSAVQMKQARRLDVIHDKLERVETTLSLRLERAQLAAERLEHRLHMLQTSVQASIKESNDKLERSQQKVVESTQNLTQHIGLHRTLLEKVNGAYTDTWRRSLVMENMMRDGLTLVNATRRELADGLRVLARRQRDTRLSSAEMESHFRRLNENTFNIDNKLLEIKEAQKRFIDSCQRVQQDEYPNHVADVLDKLIEALINKTAATFHELQNIQVTIRNHDSKVVKLLSTARPSQSDATCRRLEGVFRNSTQCSIKESELVQLTEKFVALTDRADAVLQRLEARLGGEGEGEGSEVTDAADQLLLKLQGIKGENSEELEWEDSENGYFDDVEGADIMGEDKVILGARRQRHTAASRPNHRRHHHKHPYDRGPHPAKH